MRKHPFSRIDLRAVVTWVKIYKRVDCCDIKVHEQQDAYIFGKSQCSLLHMGYCRLLRYYMCICLEEEYCLNIVVGQILILNFGDFYFDSLS